MEKNIYKTLVKNDHPLGRNNYVLGRISGIAFMIFDYHTDESILAYGNVDIDEGVLMTHEGTHDQYKNFASTIEKNYPELCVFDY